MRGRISLCYLILLGLGVLLPPAGLPAQEDENGVSVLTEPFYTREQVEKASAEIPPVRFRAPDDRWSHLPRTASLLSRGKGELRVVMLGDSIVNDTSQSRWEEVVQGMYPACKVTKVACVRGGTGCWWYKEPGRVKRYVLDLNPDLLIIGGISHNDDTESVREVLGDRVQATLHAHSLPPDGVSRAGTRPEPYSPGSILMRRRR